MKKIVLILTLFATVNAHAYKISGVSSNYWKVTCYGGSVGYCTGSQEYCSGRAGGWCGEDSTMAGRLRLAGAKIPSQEMNPQVNPQVNPRVNPQVNPRVNSQ